MRYNIALPLYSVRCMHRKPPFLIVIWARIHKKGCYARTVRKSKCYPIAMYPRGRLAKNKQHLRTIAFTNSAPVRSGRSHKVPFTTEAVIVMGLANGHYKHTLPEDKKKYTMLAFPFLPSNRTSWNWNTLK